MDECGSSFALLLWTRFLPTLAVLMLFAVAPTTLCGHVGQIVAKPLFRADMRHVHPARVELVLNVEIHDLAAHYALAVVPVETLAPQDSDLVGCRSAGTGRPWALLSRRSPARDRRAANHRDFQSTTVSGAWRGNYARAVFLIRVIVFLWMPSDSATRRFWPVGYLRIAA